MKLNPNNFCIIMAGGFGSRFWPICSFSQPKQFIDLLGTGVSMIQETFRRFEAICPRENIIIVTLADHEDMVREQIPDLLDYQVLCEPFRRNTAPCVAYAAAIIYSINPNANIVVTPSDHAIFGEEAFANNILDAIRMADRYDRIVTIGVSPTTPDVKYGYIQFRQTNESLEGACSGVKIHKVITFMEKPPLEMAVQFIRSGEFLWNAGIFVWRLPVLMEAFHHYLPSIADSFFNLSIDTDSERLKKVYELADTISVDNGIIEKAENVYVMEAQFGWSDVETWNSLHLATEKDSAGNAVTSGHVVTYESHNCVVHLPADKYAIIHGLDDYIVAQGPDVLLICPRDQEEQLIKYGSDIELARRLQRESEGFEEENEQKQ